MDNKLFLPIQVGASLATEHIPGALYDNTGDNISEKNPIYCELTAQYWAWKNVNADYYGFFHYRRYLSFDVVYPVDSYGKIMNKRIQRPYTELDDIKGDLSHYHLEQKHMESVIQSYDLLTVLREKINISVYRQYCQFHNKDTLDAVIDILRKHYPQYMKAAEEYLNSKEIYYLNMFIMKKGLFQEYSSWLFDILCIYEKSDSYKSLGEKRERLMGYLAERLFGIFYTYQRKNGAICAELSYLKFYNTEIDSERASVQATKNMRKVKLGILKIKVDMKMFNRIFPAGSRRRILIRNIFLR